MCQWQDAIHSICYLRFAVDMQNWWGFFLIIFFCNEQLDKWQLILL